jgi:hypothetical protein
MMLSSGLCVDCFQDKLLGEAHVVEQWTMCGLFIG